MAKKAAKRKVASKKLKYSRSAGSDVENECAVTRRALQKADAAERAVRSRAESRPSLSACPKLAEGEKSPEKEVVALTCRGQSRGTMAVGFG